MSDRVLFLAIGGMIGIGMLAVTGGILLAWQQGAAAGPAFALAGVVVGSLGTWIALRPNQDSAAKS